MFRNYMPTRDQVQARVFGQSREETTTEERTRLAVCKILRGQDKEIVGCGVLVFDPDFDDHISGLSKYCIITSKEVIEKENFLDGSINQVKFSKEPREKCFDLNGFSKSVKDVPSGLVLIFIDPRHRDLNHGYLMKKKCSILSKSPLLMTNSGQDRQLFCYVANKCYNIVKSSGEDGEYVLKATTVESEPDEIPNGTVILQGANKDVRAVGVFNVVDKTNMVVSPIWLKSSISDILGGQAPTPSTAGGVVSANGTSPSPAGPSSNGGGQAPTPSTAGGVVSANGTTPSPAGPSSNVQLPPHIDCHSTRAPPPQEVMCAVALAVFETIDPSNQEQLNDVLQYLTEFRNLLIVEARPGSLTITDSRYTLPKPERILNITVATTDMAWNILAKDSLAIELAKNPRVKVCGLVPRSTQEQRDQATKSNIELVDAKRNLGYPEEELIAHPPDNLDIDIVIIHSYGHNLGKQAQYIKEKKNCKWVHVVHTISAELEFYMRKVSSTDAANPDWLSDHALQLALCEEADIIIAIGPKVADAYKRALRHCGKHKDVITMTPGIIHDLVGVHKVCEGGEKFHVMISATYPSKYFKVKGCDIAAKAITLLEDLSYHLTFVVFPNDDAEVLLSQLEGLISFSQVTVKHVPRSTENWRKQLCQVDVVILPSAEGFGTSCVRAISAGVPVLSSGNSGFGMALKKLPSGKMHVLDSEKPQDWADKIRELRDKGPTQLAREAKQLREEYMTQYCWKDQCDKHVNALMEIVPNK